MTATDYNSTSRPWYKPHLSTAIAVLAVGAALIAAQVEPRNHGMFGGLGGFTTFYVQGWPAICYRFTVSEPLRYAPYTQQSAATTARTNSRWVVSGLLVNIIASLLMIASTAVTCERWRRRNARPWQFSLPSLLLLTAVTAILLYLYRDEFAIHWLRSGIVYGRWYGLPYGLHVLPWYIVAPLVFGIGCVIFTLFSIALSATSTLIRAIWQPGGVSSNSKQADGDLQRDDPLLDRGKGWDD